MSKIRKVFQICHYFLITVAIVIFIILSCAFLSHIVLLLFLLLLILCCYCCYIIILIPKCELFDISIQVCHLHSLLLTGNKSLIFQDHRYQHKPLSFFCGKECSLGSLIMDTVFFMTISFFCVYDIDSDVVCRPIPCTFSRTVPDYQDRPCDVLSRWCSYI